MYQSDRLICKKSFLLDGQTRPAKSSSQRVSLPVAQPLKENLARLSSLHGSRESLNKITGIVNYDIIFFELNHIFKIDLQIAQTDKDWHRVHDCMHLDAHRKQTILHAEDSVMQQDTL